MNLFETRVATRNFVQQAPNLNLSQGSSYYIYFDFRLEPKDKNITELLQRLVKANQQKQEQALSMDKRCKDMDKLAFAEDEENRSKVGKVPCKSFLV